MLKTLSSLKEMENFTLTLVKNPIRVFILQGGLGSGKTTLVRLFAKHFCLDHEVSSPTFTLMNVYEGENISINHFDLYRLSGPAEALEWGFEEHVGAADYNFIEWAERAMELISKPYVLIKLEYGAKENERLISVETIF